REKCTLVDVHQMAAGDIRPVISTTYQHLRCSGWQWLKNDTGGIESTARRARRVEHCFCAWQYLRPSMGNFPLSKFHQRFDLAAGCGHALHAYGSVIET